MPATRPRPSARELLGGRWAVSLRVWAVGSAFALVIPFFSLRAFLHAEAPELVGLVLAQWAALSAVYLSAHLAVFRRRRASTVSLPTVVALAALLGLARVGAVIALEALPGGQQLAPATQLVLVLAIVPGSVLGFLLAIYLIAIEDWFATERARFLHFEIDAEAARLRAIGALDATRAITTARIRDEIEDQLAALEAERREGGHLGLSGAVLETAAGYVRPTSHALWNAGEPAPRRSRVREIERVALATPLPILLPFALWVGSMSPGGFARNGLLPTIVNAVALLAGMLVCYPLGTRAIRRLAPAPHLLRARLIALAAVAAATAPLLVVTQWQSDAPSTALFAAGALMVLIFTVGVALVRSALDVQNARIGELRSQAEESEFRRLSLEAATEQMQRDLARYLHGTVQAGLVASAYAIQDAAARGDEVALERAIAEARATAARVGDHAPTPASGDLDAKRREIDDTWEGILALTWSVTAKELDAPLVERIGNVVQECLANASIHGSAMAARVHITSAGDGSAVVEVADDGSGPGGGPPGLGSAVLNEATDGAWTIASAPTGGAHVRAVIPA